MKFSSNIIIYESPSTSYTKEFTEVQEESSFKQTKLIMGSSIKSLTDDEKKYAAIIYNVILGNSPNSKLFKSVRETKSYAYTISSSINRLDGLFIINAGISLENYEDTKKEIYKQLDYMKEGNFTEKDLKSAKELALSILKEVDDNPISIIDHYNNYLYYGADTLKDAYQKVKNITKEDVIKVAKKIEIDTIYLLKEDENE
jgi:predicted Zn-dependent peptidase